MKALASRIPEIKMAPPQETHTHTKHPMQRTTMKKGQGLRTGEGTKVGDIISNSRRQL
jgi:hypothetical protein